MKEGLRIAQTMGYESAFLIGDPNYYQRFGYKLTHLYGINHESLPAEYVMVKEFVTGALEGVTVSQNSIQPMRFNCSFTPLRI